MNESVFEGTGGDIYMYEIANERGPLFEGVNPLPHTYMYIKARKLLYK